MCTSCSTWATPRCAVATEAEAAEPSGAPVTMTTPLNGLAVSVACSDSRFDAWSASAGHAMVETSASSDCSTSDSFSVRLSASAAAEISSQRPGSTTLATGASWLRHSMFSRRSLRSRSRWPSSDTPVPSRRPLTASSTAPFSSSTSMSASTAVGERLTSLT
ncbi:Uncharacterised protein [Mycobacteroides abscessus subsp. abscessus]|nr:Uncharacterised protein [Mycobacteroides abscessus subsp. abscessus]